MLHLIPIIFLLTNALAVQAQPADIEQAIARYVDNHDHEARQLLEQVVNINSGTMNFAGVRKVGEFFITRFDALGFQTRWVDGESFERAGHFIAERRGEDTRLLLIGHLDTVFELDSPFQHFEMRNDSIAAGPGIGDMKGGDIIILQALRALDSAGVLQGMDITVIMTGDEERSGRPLDLARKDLFEAAERADIALAFENGDGDPGTAIVARRGSTSWTLNVSGRPAHSSQIFREDVGAGAIYEAARILTGFYDGLAGEEFLTFNPGVILGGTEVNYDNSQARGTAFGKRNVVAETAVVSGDLRTISKDQLQRAKQAMHGIVKKHLPKTQAALTFDDSYPPLAPTVGNKELLRMFDQVSRDLGLGPVTAVDPNRAGAADVSFTAGLVDMALDGLGLGGADDHTERETGDLRTLSIQAKRAAVLMYRLTKKD